MLVFTALETSERAQLLIFQEEKPTEGTYGFLTVDLIACLTSRHPSGFMPWKRPAVDGTTVLEEILVRLSKYQRD